MKTGRYLTAGVGAGVLLLLCYTYRPRETALSGEAVFGAYCAACHRHGSTGAPRFGDEAEWGRRLEAGEPLLVRHALEGYRGMPPRGTCGICTDEEMRRAVRYMIDRNTKQSGPPPGPAGSD